MMLPFLFRHIELSAPEVILLLGVAGGADGARDRGGDHPDARALARLARACR